MGRPISASIPVAYQYEPPITDMLTLHLNGHCQMRTLFIHVGTYMECLSEYFAHCCHPFYGLLMPGHSAYDKTRFSCASFPKCIPCHIQGVIQLDNCCKHTELQLVAYCNSDGRGRWSFKNYVWRVLCQHSIFRGPLDPS